MREILFRGKPAINGEWISGFLVDENHIGDFLECAPVVPETVSQYTGSDDKNGEKIFEGDIVECLALSVAGIPERHKGLVAWGTYGWVINFGELEPWQGTGFRLVGLGCVKDIEVIGNIHDDPEILKLDEPSVL